MKSASIAIQILSMALTAIFLLPGVPAALAHCDGMDGPVVTAANSALESGNINLVYIWIQKEYEPEIKAAFQKTLAVRKLNPQARDLADMYFFETLVRIHRAGEGEPYTGLKPAGRNLGPAIPAADKSIKTGSIDELSKLLTETVREQLDGHFHKVMASAEYSKDDVEAGRRFVSAYVEYIHFVEQLYDSARALPEGHNNETQTPHHK